MAEIVLFHHVCGLTDGVRRLADTFRAAGHTVHTPDLFDGRTFPSIEEGVAFVREQGFGTLIERGTAAAGEATSGDVVVAGISFGVLPAQRLAQTRPGVRGALLLEACVPVTEFGDAWPPEVAVQVHGMDADPEFAMEGDLDAARGLVAAAPDAELFLYPGDSHLFVDDSLPSYDEAATELLTRRVLEFLDRVG